MVAHKQKAKLKDVIEKRKLELGVGPKSEEGPGRDMLIIPGEEDNDKAKKAMSKAIQA